MDVKKCLKFFRSKKLEGFKGSRVEMVEDDGWALPGWTGIVVIEDSASVVVRWDNGKRLSHMKNNLRMIPMASFDDPNAAFKFRKHNV